ncbi:GntR family transcriptional regulator [Agrobacterium fabrum]|uniref:GntR family transcriptional regulator n=1 Tax=Agrobacterium fabrum TaxID=1176649 RepID=UPI001571B6AD|nr:GntR family transcriptional regulator [Agrobacterium fabrum]WIE30931.1 GntR family transcriptional regulator [Agrobacterium fabrum]WIE46878.1 GntR family transcriptional regulator [Agrobacterium fabrum]
MANQLHRALAAKILRHVRTNGLQTGHHLTEASLSDLLGTSRGPIRAALALLIADGHVIQVPNRGFFLGNVVSEPTLSAVKQDASSDDEALYLSIADDRLVGNIAQTVSEPDLMRRYDIPRPRLRRILTRIATEGWIERREGRGWSFVQLIDSVEAYRESYELRQMLEPAGLINDSFKLDEAILNRLRQQQVMVRDGGWKTLSQIELFETNAQFHEGLAEMSGNRFLLGTIERQNQLRRLVEYRQTLNREQVRGQNNEHLDILDTLERGLRFEASQILAHHLGNAKNRKARSTIFEVEAPMAED